MSEKNKIKLEVLEELYYLMRKVWSQYENDTENCPKPDFMSAVALLACLEDKYENE